MADDNDFGDYLKAAAVLAVAVAASSAVNAALQGKQKNAVQVYPLNQPIMPVTNFVGGYSKTAGAYVFRDVHSNNYATIQAISEGRLDSFNGFYLADDKVTINGSGSVDGVTNGGTTITDGRYQDDDGKRRVVIQTRLGLPTETAYSDIVAGFPDVWDSSCRGDNTGSICVQRFSTDTKFQNTIFPAGPVDASVVARGVCYDWRKDSTAGGMGSQRRTDDTTWGWCANPIIWLVHKEWTAWGRDWDTQIAPLLADLTIEADYCDTPFPLKAGGTQPIYTVAFNYPDDEDYTTTRQRILDAMDGFYCEDGFGRLVLKAGRYEEPDLTFTGDDIFASHWEGGELSSDAVDLINVSFMSPENDYKIVQCDPWIINEGGTLPSDLTVDGVDNVPQARYLTKRKAARLMPNYRGWIKVGRKGRKALKKRYIRVQNPRRPSMNDVACEIMGIEYEPSDRSFTINLISADPNIDAWNPATEEGDPVNAVPGVDPGILDAPVIDTVTPFYDGINIRLRVAGNYPDRDDITPVTSWRVAGGVWDDRTNADYVDNGGGSLTTESNVVTPDSSLEVRIAYLTSKGALSDWSATETINSSVVPPTWAAPGALWDMETTTTSNRFWTGDTEYASYAAAVSASKASLTRSGSKLAANTSGVYSSFATNVIAMTNKGASLEPASTSKAGNSDTLSNGGWTASGATKTAGQTTPFGSDGASILNAGAAVHSFGPPSLTYTALQVYTYVVYMPAGTVTRYQLTMPSGSFGTGQYANFLLSGAGSITAQAGLVGASIVLENGYYILSISATATTTAASQRPAVSTIQTGTDARLPSYTSTDTWLVYRGEILDGAGYGTPIISTSGAVTRNADALLIKPVPGTYDIDITLSDASVVSLSNVTITSSGWTVPTGLNRYVTRITGFAP